MTEPRLVRFRGPEQLEVAVATVLERRPDLVLVERLLTRAQVRRLALAGADVVDRLYDVLPEFEAIDHRVAAWWRVHGYIDYEVATPRICPGEAKVGGIPIHCDEDQFEANSSRPHLLFGPVSMSIGLTRTPGWFSAQRSEANWYLPDGSYNGAGLTELLASDRHPLRAGHPLRTAVRQGIGDAVLFATHPTPAFHSVEAPTRRRARPPRRARSGL